MTLFWISYLNFALVAMEVMFFSGTHVECYCAKKKLKSLTRYLGLHDWDLQTDKKRLDIQPKPE